MEGRRPLTRWWSGRAAVLLAVWLVSGAYLYLRADRGWIPHDEGTLAHAAERVLAGELPHRDFDDPYTGGLSFLHALAFEVFGIRLLALRWMLLAAALLFVPAMYGIATRVATPIVAGLTTLAALALSLPNYFASLPSWYNLFLAAFGTLALLRHVDTDRRRWLFVAGVCGGLSFLVKAIGLYYCAAALLFLVYREQGVYREQACAAPESARARRTWAFSLFTTGCLLAFALALLVLVRRGLRAMELLHFALPGMALSFLLIAREWSVRRGGERRRWRRLLKLVAPFLAGLVLPVALFAVPYARSSSLPALVRGVFVLPQRRFSDSAYALPSASTLLYASPLVLVLVLGFLPARAFQGRAWLAVAGLAAALGLLLFGLLPAESFAPAFAPSAAHVAAIAALLAVLPLAFGAQGARDGLRVVPAALLLAAIAVLAGQDGVYAPVFATLRPLVPLAALGACALLGAPALARAVPEARRQEVLLLAAMAAMTSLVQFPYAFGVYFCYAAPFAVLAALYVVASQPAGARPVHLCLLGFYLAFALLWLNPGFVRAVGKQYVHVEQDTPLPLARGGLRVPRADAEGYGRLVGEIARRSAPDEPIYAAPDCPEVYFLSGRKNPTRTFFDIFEEGFETDPRRRADDVLRLLERADVRLVVFNRLPEFSGSQHALRDRLMESYAPIAGDVHFLLLQRKRP